MESNPGLDRIALGEQTLADRFRAGGYGTGMVGKWHNGLHDLRYHPNRRGFDEFAGFLNGGMGYWDWIIEHNGQPMWPDGRYLTDVFTEEAVSFIERHRNEPFFLYVAYNAPHGPLEAPDEDVAPFVETGQFTRAVSQTYGMIRRMDAGVGRVLDALEANGLAEDTIVLYSSDNGPVLQGRGENDQRRYNGPFRGMKYDVLEGGIRVPGLIRWPDGLPRNETVDKMFHFTDWTPTLLQACGIDAPSDTDGMNVLDTLRGESTRLPTKRFWQFNRYDPVDRCNAAMRDGAWKLYWPRVDAAMAKLKTDNPLHQKNFEVPHFEMDVSNPPVERAPMVFGHPELFHLGDDPCEEKNLATEHPHRVSKMKDELANWFENVERDRREIP